MEISRFELYSLGYVVEDILEDDLLLKIVPIELISDIDGELGDVDKETNKNINIEKENKITIKTKDTVIIAKWVPLSETNRMTPPTVCKGETVRIFRYAETDKYFWATLYNEIDLKKREKVVYAFSNKGSIEDKSLSKNMYYVTLDTINKVVRIHTDDTDGELTTYDIEINTKDGLFTLIDGKSNMIELDSDRDKLTVTINKDIEMNAPNITMNSEVHTINTNTYIRNANRSILTTNVTLYGDLIASRGEITHKGKHIDSSHLHIGNLGFPVSPPIKLT